MTPSPEMIQRLRAWTYQRLLLGDPVPDPVEALRYVVAVYSSNPTAPLALLNRSQIFDADRLIEMEERREVVRIPAMRGSIFLTPTETASRIFAATRLPKATLVRRLKVGEFTWEDYERIKPRVLEFACEPVTPRQLQTALDMDRRLMIAVRVMALEGLMLRLSASLRSDNLRYVATDAWLGGSLEEVDADEALSWLAGEYLRSYGPARVEDFAWWVGVPKGKAQAAVATVEAVEVGDGLLLPLELATAFECVEPLDPAAIAILPKWDAYTMGYQGDGRQRLLHDEHRPLAYNKAGDGLPLVLRGGRAVAVWSHRFERDRMRLTVSPFEPDSLPGSVDEDAFAGAGQVLGATEIEVVSDGPQA